ncbi:hypothetical protein DYBT9623_03090 [Dyadobacter sp. CECT 9623]|uniref:Polymerase nucleotidyl transferase domain-containing protein n=1 Tax=Dyadobacter linearis TaxID=2823330 RepID=A0ABM8US58_9BACT|nr:nucleotidyltransferase domain-containing protein [Dyadobacter sp. CECT 9623]CAG5070545.1 hypothetical protein DYBT9623_03090 [Dyadobacter sp. CECT 9623]
MSNRKVPESISALTQEFVARVSELYGERLNQVILFGSYARGEQREDSDIDYLVVLNDEEIKSFAEISVLSPITSALGLKYNLWISAVPFTVRKLLPGNAILSSEIHKDGIVI